MFNVDKSVADIAATHGFAMLKASDLAEINGSAYVMRHEATGARLLYLKNEDPNKAFSIGFKTPAADDTGVFHILEHSVLCGSDKFPVKEPFVNLLKSSMQTFLNAMTFPDKTMYPVASTNEQDLLNLMDVYLDAVFNPLIYSKETIFQQEGWHYELTAGSTQDAKRELQINGVVYNEMKGALSEPDSVLYDALTAELFPDTTYSFESGGTPEGIPTLTYDAFLDTHSRHYVPSNSYIVLYGDLNIDRFLAFLNDEYLAHMTDAKIKAPINELALQDPVVNMGARKEMTTSPDNSCMALGYVVGTSKQRERIMAVDILLDAIMGSNESPMKRALLDAGIADDAHAYLSDGVAQPFVVVELKGLRSGATARFLQIVEEQARVLSDGALDRKLVEASLSHAEFVMREHNMGYADGVIYAITALSGWLYDDECALDFLKYEDAFADLRKKLDEGYFERLIAEVFLENNHKASVELVPVNADDAQGANDEARTGRELAARLAAMTEAQIEDIKSDVEKLRAAQTKPDPMEDLEKLPVLHLEDISDAPFEAAFSFNDVKDDNTMRLPLIYHDVATNGISYAYRYFDLSCLTFEELSYVSILSSVLGKLDTEHHAAADLDTEIHSKLGNLNFYPEVHESILSDGVIRPMFVISSSALSENTSYAAELANEIVLTSNFHDYNKLRDILIQKRVAAEQMFTSAGHSVAMGRVSSYYSKAGVLRDQLSGVENYLFVKELLEDFEDCKEPLADKLGELCNRIFADANCTLSFAGGKDALNAYVSSLSPLNDRAQVNGVPSLLDVPDPVDKREALVIPTDVTYTAVGAKRESEYNGAWLVATRALSYDYLWNEVRVVGGAYGAGFQTTISGSSRFYSYRDPRVSETVGRFRSSGEWLSHFDPPAREFEGYIVSTVASMDAPVKPRDLIRRQDGMFFSGYTPEMRLKTRSQVLATTLPSLRELGSSVTQISEADHVCVVGNRDIINGSDLDLNVRELIRV